MRLPFMEVFDSPDRLLSCARREQSTHAPQALELLNGDFSQRRWRGRWRSALRRRRAVPTEAGRPRLCSWRSAALPDPAERKAALQLSEGRPSARSSLWRCSWNDFLYVNED